MRPTFNRNAYRYRKVRDLESVPSGFAMRKETRTLLRVEYTTEGDPNTVRVFHAIKGISYSFGDVHRHYRLCTDDGEEIRDERGIPIGELTVPALVDEYEHRRWLQGRA